MEQIILFLEEYWGVSIAGGITFGTIVTFIIVQVKALLMNSLKNTQIGDVLFQTNQVVNTYQQLEQRHKALEAQVKYSEQVNLATFKAIAYVVMASKLPIEEKLALQKEFEKLKPVVSEGTAGVVPQIKVEVTPQTVETVVKAAGDLISKYTKAE